ncbi:hypothetical protein AB6A40_001767 [Gnathostoma spinigerum]|uniref:Uncharacterized protein n=1 Tax=Gnathostoma spinigerum TaxID=75299 RepID=A0ABD6EDY8_9BILA
MGDTPLLFMLLLRMLLIPWCSTSSVPHFSELFHPRLPVLPPHCTKTAITRSTLSHAAGDLTARTVMMNLHIALGTTVCFRLENGSKEEPEPTSFLKDILPDRTLSNSWLHTLTLSQLEHHHPISQTYTFAIPEVRTSCICDCDPASSVCSARTHSFAMCSVKNNSKVGGYAVIFTLGKQRFY